MRRRKKTGIFRRLRYVVIEHLLDRRLGAAAFQSPTTSS
jgi:hypothetical protein